MSATEDQQRDAADALAGVTVRVSVEIGRARLPFGRAVRLDPGAVVELDRGADDLAELYVNDRRFGAGRLILVDGEWALRVEWVSGGDAEADLARAPSAPPASADYPER